MNVPRTCPCAVDLDYTRLPLPTPGKLHHPETRALSGLPLEWGQEVVEINGSVEIKGEYDSLMIVSDQPALCVRPRPAILLLVASRELVPVMPITPRYQEHPNQTIYLADNICACSCALQHLHVIKSLTGVGTFLLYIQNTVLLLTKYTLHPICFSHHTW